jgi:hypothetical protein
MEIRNMSKKLISSDTRAEAVDLDRRSALSRLGLAISAAYAAPVLVTLSQSAHAKDGKGGGGKGGGNGGGKGGGKGGKGGKGGSAGSAKNQFGSNSSSGSGSSRKSYRDWLSELIRE